MCSGEGSALLCIHIIIKIVYSRIISHNANEYLKMPKKAKVGAANGKAPAKVKNTSWNDEDCNCGLCCEPVKDDENDGLYCEGACAQWFHRYCAGVTVFFSILNFCC